MSKNVSDQILERLAEWGVTHVFGYPGDGINGIMGAFNRDDHGCRFVQARHEEMAAFMACSYAKFTGKVGVCLATSGPGAIHLLNGLYDAKMDHQPVVAIVGQAATTAMGGSYQQEVDLQTLFKDVASEYVHTAMSPDQIRFLIDRAFRIAASEHCPTCVIVPKDVQEMSAVETPPHAHDTVHTSAGYSPPRVLPAESEIKRAADILNAGEKVAILVGAGAKDALDEVLFVQDLHGRRDREGAPRACGRPRRPPVRDRPDRPPRIQAELGHDDGLRHAAHDRLVVPLFGVSSEGGKGARGADRHRPEADRDSVPDGGQPRRRREAHARRARTVLEAEDGARVGEGDRRKRRRVVAADGRPGTRRRPGRSTRSASSGSCRRSIPDKAILCADSGSAANWFARDLKIRRGMQATLSGSLATMGCGVPYAIGAKFAHPDRPVIALVGDGAMQMNGMNELLTIKRYWKEWKDPRLVILVLHNNDLNQVTWEMRAMAGDTRYAASQDLPDFAYADYAELVGLRGIKVDLPEQIAAAWDEAFASSRPVRRRGHRRPRRAAAPAAHLAEADAELRHEPVEGGARGVAHHQGGDRTPVSSRREEGLRWQRRPLTKRW